jgi:TolA-binding protein
LILQDYPDDPYAAKSLFMMANLQIDRWGDIVSARAFLNKLINQYPESEMVDQAQYMLDNMTRQEFRTPTSIEELRK